jgi:hypothetical protein
LRSFLGLRDVLRAAAVTPLIVRLAAMTILQIRWQAVSYFAQRAEMPSPQTPTWLMSPGACASATDQCARSF